MNEVEHFLKCLIESKGYKKLVSINSINYYLGDRIVDVESYISFIKSYSGFYKGRDIKYQFIVGTSSLYKNRKVEYLLNSEYTLELHDIIDFYARWKREKSIDNIL